MQSESYLVNDLIISEMATTHPDSLCYTVFDGFLVEQKYLPFLMSTIQQKSLDHLRFEASIMTTGTIVPEPIQEDRKDETDDLIGDLEKPYYEMFVNKLAERGIVKTKTELYTSFWDLVA